MAHKRQRIHHLTVEHDIHLAQVGFLQWRVVLGDVKTGISRGSRFQFIVKLCNNVGPWHGSGNLPCVFIYWLRLHLGPSFAFDQFHDVPRIFHRCQDTNPDNGLHNLDASARGRPIDQVFDHFFRRQVGVTMIVFAGKVSYCIRYLGRCDNRFQVGLILQSLTEYFDMQKTLETHTKARTQEWPTTTSAAAGSSRLLDFKTRIIECQAGNSRQHLIKPFTFHGVH
mmetsp:Transcript_8665/g.15739  ORF Transcript_8665/g.15739 Transcript_8665/m.15739 type:complete len:225 (-) Transcript_8665:1817-2491(-)